MMANREEFYYYGSKCPRIGKTWGSYAVFRAAAERVLIIKQNRKAVLTVTSEETRLSKPHFLHRGRD